MGIRMSKPKSHPEKRIALFPRMEVRRVIHNHEVAWRFRLPDDRSQRDKPLQAYFQFDLLIPGAYTFGK